MGGQFWLCSHLVPRIIRTDSKADLHIELRKSPRELSNMRHGEQAREARRSTIMHLLFKLLLRSS